MTEGGWTSFQAFIPTNLLPRFPALLKASNLIKPVNSLRTKRNPCLGRSHNRYLKLRLGNPRLQSEETAVPASIFSETELARLASFPEEIPGDDLIRAFTLTGADRDLVAIRRRAANRLGLALQLLCTSLPRLRSAQFERSSAIGRLLCRGPARGQPGRDSILRSTRADALHSTSPRFGNTSASRCSGHGTWKNSKLGRLERALEHDAPKVLFRLAREWLRTERLVFPAPDRIVRLVSSARGRAQERTYTLVEPQVARAGCFWREPGLHQERGGQTGVSPPAGSP